ncbi:MAG: phosphatase PAP2 family protein [Propionibacteriaceae bacterium]|nr:phosphatase PAP2 family protein [Propionibacteriaceae bacterium]
MTALTRYRRDDRAPTLGAAARDLAVRAIPSTLGLLVLGLVAGWVVILPLSSWTGEDRLNLLLRAGRTPTQDGVARFASTIGGVTGNAVICVLAVALIWALSRKWWLAVLPWIALNLHIFVHIVTSTVIARQRPDVEPLDIGQPTASFPSGHMGATTAQLLVVVLFLRQWLKSIALRMVIVATTCVYLLVLAWSRVYLGMHHASDVVWGAVNGIACGLIAWCFLRRDPAGPDA